MSKNNSDLKLDEIVKMAMNNHGLIQQFIGLYIENLEEMKDSVPQYMMAGHIDSLRAAYHKNLPSLKIIGATKLIDGLDEAKKLLANNDSQERVLAETQSILSTCNDLVGQLVDFQIAQLMSSHSQAS